MAANLAFAAKLRDRLAAIPELRDVQLNPAQDYPTIDLSIDRVQAATMSVTARDIGMSLIPATASSRYMQPIYWRDPKNGQAYIVQVQIPPPQMGSTTALGNIPVGQKAGHDANGNGKTDGTGGDPPGVVFLRDTLAPSGGVLTTTTAEEVYRYNMRRAVSITANVGTQDLGKVRKAVQKAIADTGDPPRGVHVDVRGQLNTLAVVQTSLGRGLLLAVLAIVAVAHRVLPVDPAGAGVVGGGAGDAVRRRADAVGDRHHAQPPVVHGGDHGAGRVGGERDPAGHLRRARRLLHGGAVRAAVEGGRARLRPILMTSCAMIAGMLPMAIGLSAGGDQVAPLGRAVVGGLAASTLATLLILPAVFAVVQRKAGVAGASMDPDDPNSGRYDENRVKLFDE